MDDDDVDDIKILEETLCRLGNTNVNKNKLYSYINILQKTNIS